MKKNQVIWLFGVSVCIVSLGGFLLGRYVFPRIVEKNEEDGEVLAVLTNIAESATRMEGDIAKANKKLEKMGDENETRRKDLLTAWNALPYGTLEQIDDVVVSPPPTAAEIVPNPSEKPGIIIPPLPSQTEAPPKVSEDPPLEWKLVPRLFSPPQKKNSQLPNPWARIGNVQQPTEPRAETEEWPTHVQGTCGRAHAIVNWTTDAYDQPIPVYGPCRDLAGNPACSFVRLGTMKWK